MTLGADAATLALSLETAAVATVLAGIVGVGAAVGMTGRDFRGKALVDGLLLAPLVLPPTVIGFLLLLLLGTNGPLGRAAAALWDGPLLFTWGSAVLAAAVVAVPLVYRTARGALEQIDGKLAAAARTLGARERDVTWRVLLPLARPGIVAGALLGFARALGEFGATLMVAGNIPGKTRTLPLEIYIDVERGDMAHAGQWVALMLILGVALAALAERLARPRRDGATVPTADARPSATGVARPKASEPSTRKSFAARVRCEVPGFDLDVEIGSVGRSVAVLGPSGAGKSLLLRALAGLETPHAGRIAVNERVVFDAAAGVDLPTRERRIGHVFQSYALFPHLTVAENVAFGLRAMAPEARRRRVDAWLQDLELDAVASRMPGELSGGQAQRVALARTLATEPDLLLLDEPLAALDTHLKSRVELRLKQAVDAFAGVALLVTHNLEEAFRICDDLVVLDRGRVIAAGEKHAVVAAPGTVVAAALTGCKNVAAVRVVGEETHVDAWGLSLPWRAASRADYVGMRAYHMKVSATRTPGAFACRLVAVSETPHRMTLLLRCGEAPQPMQVEVLKDVWETLRNAPEPWYLSLPAERLMALRGSP